nr:PHB depolymerase family esterase [Caldimonas sp.]
MIASIARIACAALVACATAAAAATVERTPVVGKQERSYDVDVPAGAPPQRGWPVVVVFHGGGGNAASVRTQSRMSALGAAEGFVAVYPQGSGGIAGKLRTWNAGTCCGWAMHHEVDETAFVAALLDDLPGVVAVDPRRVYATGISNGGMVAYRVACTLAGRIAAIAAVAGEMTMAASECRPTRPVPVLVIHGTADRNLPFEGGPGARALAVHEVRSVAAAIEFWRANNRCADAPVAARHGAVSRTRYLDCSEGAEVELVAIEGGGHSWPGGDRLARFLDPPSDALDASAEIWRFFARH